MILTILSSILSFVSKETADVNQALQPLYRCFPLFALPEALYAVTIQTLVSGFINKGEVKVGHGNGVTGGYYSTDLCSVPHASGGQANGKLLCGIGIDLLYLYLLAPVYLAIAIGIDLFKNNPNLYGALICNVSLLFNALYAKCPYY